MTDQVAELNAFTEHKHPGMVGIEISRCDREAVTGLVTARATPVHVGRSTHVSDAEVRNERLDRVIALFRCTQLVLYSS